MERKVLKPVLIESGDGSHTLRVDGLKEHYHSHKGALRESQHVFIRMGLEELKERPEVTILEVGFGTGLNALLTLTHTPRPDVHYITLETQPLEQELIAQLNYPQLIAHAEASSYFDVLHEADWNVPITIQKDFILEKRNEGIETFEGEGIDLVYYDAFAPHAQPELWTPEIWERLYTCMRPNGILVTYCAKGQVRRDMQAAGFEVERLEGPPGKREMIRATKP